MHIDQATPSDIPTLSDLLSLLFAQEEEFAPNPEAQARGAGVGAQLLAGAISFARGAGCRRITLLTDGSNESAQRFYARQGFAQSGMVPMRLLLT